MNQIINQPSFIKWRFCLVLGFIGCAVLGLMARVIDLAILDQHFLQRQGDERVLRMINAPAFRGMIVDRNGFPLAVSTTVYSIWANPQEFDASKEGLKALGQLLDLKPKDISQLVLRNLKKKREFAYLKRGLSPEVAKQIKTLAIPGLFAQEEYRRYYPEGEMAAHLIGFTNVDDQGQEGLELAYDQWLKGEQGKKWAVKDRLGRVISDVRTVQEQKDGHDLTLSIDRRIQYLAYRELLAGVTENEARAGSVVVLDLKTGEILAMVNQPSFNPNNRAGVEKDNFRNRAVTDSFEPGSTIKAFTVASALEINKIRPNTTIDTAPGWMLVDRKLVRDEHNNGVLSITQILQKSSNMGAAKIVLNMPANQLWSLLNRVGFGEETGIGFPGEQSGSLTKHNPWGNFVLATLSYGYGMSATPLQLTRAYAVLANKGLRLPVSLLKVDKPPQGKRVLNEKVANEMMALLETVVQGGTGGQARVPGYRVAGKTGTSKIVGPHGYEKHRYNSTFVGIAPVSNPRLIVAVVIQDPRGEHYHGGTVSAPVFAKVMEGALRILSVAPDEEQVAMNAEKNKKV